MVNQNENLANGGIETKSSRRARIKNSRGLGLFLLLAVTAFLRLYDLGAKPPHFDEGINGHFVTTIWRDGFYTYDPTNFHGPLYFYLCHLAEILLGRSVDSFRAMNAVLAVLVVFSVYRFRIFTGRTATIAAWVLALSPAFTFYGRYAIHETLFILGQLLFVFGRFSWLGRPQRSALVWMALGIVILITTKETFFIFLGIWVIAETTIWFIERLESSKRPWSTFESLNASEKREMRTEAASIAGLALLAIVALFTGFFEHPDGLRDFGRAFMFWTKTGVGASSGHEKPFFYWIELLVKYEWPLLAGFCISILGSTTLGAEDRKQRVLLLTGFGTWLAYSIIPYKTPWLILNFWPLAFFALPVFDARKSWTRRALFFGVLILLFGVSAHKMWDLSFRRPTDPKEPYVYVQTTMDYSSVMTVLRKKIAKNPEVRNAPIVVMIQDPWPLPFDLSLYPKMRYVKLEDVDKNPKILETAGLVLVDGTTFPGLVQVLPKRFAKMNFKMRDAYGAGFALFDAEIFEDVLPANAEYESAAGGRRGTE
jgi:uncharacterized protein (TIGR03663 family)